MNHWIVAPIILPGLTAAFLVLVLRHNLAQQRIISIASTALLLALTVGLFTLAGDGAARPYLLGAWPAPFGIVLVLDLLSATMALLTAVLAMAVVLYASNDWDQRGWHFHALFQFQLMGINGAFLTGDVFNLFVFFEVMLIASYGLMLHGGGARRLKAGFQYVAINLVGSTLFLFAVGLIYAVTGTLNMADLAVKVSQVEPGDAAILHVGVLLLFLVFALKSALAPLHWWLPTAYAAAPAPSAALFMIMTKVGAYSIIRVHALVFGSEAGAVAQVAAPWIIPAALVTLVIGALGVLATRRLGDLVCFAVIWSMGSLLVAIGLFDGPGLTAALYYTVHSTLAGASLFLLVDLIAERRGRWLDQLSEAPRIVQSSLIAGLFFLAAIAMVGLPPLSGFIGKLLILDAARQAPAAVWIWSLTLATSLMVILGFSRAGSLLFWKSEALGGPVEVSEPRHGAPAVVAVSALIAATAFFTVFAGPATRSFETAAGQILDPRGYVGAVLGVEAAAGLGER
jgi:multicomponent K+:H+ antiporter subunit D